MSTASHHFSLKPLWQRSLLGCVATCAGLNLVTVPKSALAVDFIQFGNTTYPVEQLSSFAETGVETPLIADFIAIKRPDNSLEEMQEGLNRKIDVDVDRIDELTVKGLHPNDFKWINETFPGITDQQLRDLVRTVYEYGQDMTVINFIEGFPLETLTTEAALERSLSVNKSNPVPSEPPKQLLTPPTEPSDNNMLKVLWYAQNSSRYNNAITQLAANAHSFDPWGDGSQQWDLTLWQKDEPTPNFSDYDVFVISNTTGGFYGFDSQRLLENKDEISAARGTRTFITGQDVDNHYFSHFGKRPDGPLGFMVNAVNWAGNGQGLGIISFADGCWRQRGHDWWLHEDSFLKDELEGNVICDEEDYVVIPESSQHFPVNEGLSSAGLSNWKASSHASFRKDIPGYVSINDAGRRPGWAVTIVTESEVDGETRGSRQVPEPSMLLGFLTLGGLGFLTRKC